MEQENYASMITISAPLDTTTMELVSDVFQIQKNARMGGLVTSPNHFVSPLHLQDSCLVETSERIEHKKFMIVHQ